MFCSQSVVVLAKIAVLCAISSPNFSLITHPHIDNDSRTSEFWCVAKTRYLYNFLGGL
jgi:hypothetical protein